MKYNFYNIADLEDKINIGFFTSRGGVSKGNFFSLNCSKNNKDNKKNVFKNLKIAKKELNIENKKLKLINQTHSNKIFLINKNNYEKEFYGDGLITMDKNIALGVLTADCAPIFLFDIKKKFICCLHSGWKGTLLNIVNKSIKKIECKQNLKKNIYAVVGPCLGYSNFEVDKDFKLKFIRQNRSYRNFFKSKNLSKDLFNLRGMINYQLKNAGINKIYNIRKDTYNNALNFFSHRRSSHNKMTNTGRMINIISFKD